MSPITGPQSDAFVGSEGERVWHQTGMKCYCRQSDGDYDPNCDDHDATGHVYSDKEIIVGLVTDVTQRKELIESGFFAPGDLIFSPLTSDIVTEGDKITLTYPLAHGDGDIVARGSGDTDRLTYEAISGIFCLDRNKVYYKDGLDFRLNGKTIEWSWVGKDPTRKKPAQNVKYVIKYKAYIEWVVFLPPMERFSVGDNIGPRVGIRKLHLFEG